MTTISPANNKRSAASQFISNVVKSLGIINNLIQIYKKLDNVQI